MSLIPTFGVPAPIVQLEPVSRDLFAWDAAHASWGPDDGELRALTGHSGVWGRSGGTLAAVDSAGASYTAVGAQMAWEQRAWNGAGVRDSFGLRMGTADTLYFPNPVQVMAHCGMLEMIETGARVVNNACVFSHRAVGGGGAGLWISSDGTHYGMHYSDGGVTRSVVLTGGQPAVDDRVIFFWELTSAGVLMAMISINGGAAIPVTAAALALPSTWGTDPATRLNSNGTTNVAQGWYRRLRIAAGALSTAAMLLRF